jgi:O-antigen/teichoic acid export membrane protein
VPTIATSIYTVLDKTLIGMITHDNYTNGYYEYATKVLHILKNLVFTSVNAVMGARISYLYAQERYAEIKQRIEKSMNFILLLGIGAAFGTIGVAKNFVPLFFGKGNAPVVPLLYAMAPLVVIIGVSNCLGSQYYTPSGQRAKSAKIVVLGSALNLGLNLLMIPFLGAMGATIASLVAETTISILYIVLSKGYMRFSILGKNCWKKLIAGVLMCAVVLLLGEITGIHRIAILTIQICGGVCTYAGILFLLRDNTLQWLLESTIGVVLKRWKKK